MLSMLATCSFLYKKTRSHLVFSITAFCHYLFPNSYLEVILWEKRLNQKPSWINASFLPLSKSAFILYNIFRHLSTQSQRVLRLSSCLLFCIVLAIFHVWKPFIREYLILNIYFIVSFYYGSSCFLFYFFCRCIFSTFTLLLLEL